MGTDKQQKRAHAKVAADATVKPKSIGQAVRDAFDPVLEVLFAEIDQQPEPMAAQSQLREHLEGQQLSQVLPVQQIDRGNAPGAIGGRGSVPIIARRKR